MTPQDELYTDEVWVEAYLRFEINFMTGRGHDRKTTYLQRVKCQEDALKFMNSWEFCVYCDSIGVDANNFRGLIRERAGETIANVRRFLLHQIELGFISPEEDEQDEPEEFDSVFQLGLLMDCCV